MENTKNKTTNILYVWADETEEGANCSKWNCFIPAKYINKVDGYSAQTINVNEWIRQSPEVRQMSRDADLIIVERNFFSDVLTTIQYWKVRGKSIMGIFDDAYHILHPENPAYRFWNYGEIEGTDEKGNMVVGHIRPFPITQFKWGLKMLKGVQVPSKRLAEDWLTHTDTYHIRNYLDWEKYDKVEPLYPKKDDEIVIGWQGSVSHYNSFVDSGVLEALRKVCKKYPQVKILFGGDRRVFERMEVKNKEYQPFVSDKDFTSLIKSYDIGLAPLSGEYDKRRSWVKGLEYMALKVPWIATNYDTYSELSDFGILTENGYNNWAEALTYAVENLAELKEKAKGKPFAFAKKQTSEENVKKHILPLYDKIIAGDYPNILRE